MRAPAAHLAIQPRPDPSHPPLTCAPLCCLQDNLYWLGLMTHLQADSVPLKSLDCLRDLRDMYEAAAIEDVYDAYAQVRLLCCFEPLFVSQSEGQVERERAWRLAQSFGCEGQVPNGLPSRRVCALGGGFAGPVTPPTLRAIARPADAPLIPPPCSATPQFKFDDDSVFTCIGTSGKEPLAVASPILRATEAAGAAGAAAKPPADMDPQAFLNALRAFMGSQAATQQAAQQQQQQAAQQQQQGGRQQ